MSNLFWKKSDETVLSVAEKPFAREEELESYLVKKGELLGDVVIFKRQVRANKGHDIPDLIGVDKESNIVLIELKNVLVDEEIAPQVLRYAIWAETNPDSIKALWLEYEDKPDDIEINWDALSVRIIIVAPQFKTSVPRMIAKINYPVNLLEIKRFVTGSDEFVSIESIEPEDTDVFKVTKGKEIYDENFYLQYNNKHSVKHFLETVEKIDKYQKAKGWNLEKKFNKYYAGFKYGFFNAFGVKWFGSKSFGISFKVNNGVIKATVKKFPLKYRDDSQWGELVYRVDDQEDFQPEKFASLFEKAYKGISGAK